MKLPTQTRGPVTLSKIDYAKNLSEETYAFTAVVSIVVDGKTLQTTVQNEGQGGPNNIHDREVEAALEAYAATLPPEKSEQVGDLPIDADFLMSLMVGDAIEKYELVKLLAKKILFQKTDGHLYSITKKARPVEMLIANVEKNAPGARILNNMPLNEALVVFKAAVGS